MESSAPLARQRRSSPSSDRFLALFSQSPPAESSVLGGFGDELCEDDIFWSGESSESNGSPSTSSVAVTHPPIRFQLSSPTASNNKGFGGAENYGILAALPEFGRDNKGSNRSVLNHNTSISPSAAAAASARMIPVIPRPPPERTHSMSLKYHQSAPVNVPMMVRKDLDWRRRLAGSVLNGSELGNMDDDEQEDETMLPPHEMVANRLSNSPILSSSVLEGKGRTLKGRDLRRVRNAVFRQTGFID